MANEKAGKSWRDLKSKKIETKSSSWRARLKLAATIFKYLFFIAILSGLIYGGFEMYRSGIVEKAIAPNTENLRVIEYKTNGVIEKQWIAERKLFPHIQNLAEIDIIEMRKKFEKISQIKHAEILKIYPDKIRIEVQEYTPCARIAIVQNKNIREFAISKEGAFFEPVCLSRDLLMELPWVIGVPLVLDSSNEKFEPYSPAPKIDELLNLAKLKLPEHFKTWRTINVRELSSITLPIILVTTSDNVKLIFHAQDIDGQLEKLECILQFFLEDGLKDIEKIDLSLNMRAIVTPRNK